MIIWLILLLSCLVSSVRNTPALIGNGSMPLWIHPKVALNSYTNFLYSMKVFLRPYRSFSLQFNLISQSNCLGSKIVVNIDHSSKHFSLNHTSKIQQHSTLHNIKFNTTELKNTVIDFIYADLCDHSNWIEIDNISISLESESHSISEYGLSTFTSFPTISPSISSDGSTSIRSIYPTNYPSIDNIFTTQVMCDIVAATNIEIKDLSWGCFNGTPIQSICTTWGGVLCRDGEVTEIRLEYYGLTGTIPSSLGRLTSLTFLQMVGNSLSGSIPSTLGLLSMLSDLWLGSNRLVGSIPTSFAQLSSLQVLSLNENFLTGSIPTLIGQLTSLRVLWLGANNFNGSIPSSMGRLKYLYTAYLNSNSLTGSIPSSLGNLLKIMALSVYSNSLIGSIPDTFDKLSVLTSFRIYENDLSGSLPSQLCDLSLVSFYPKKEVKDSDSGVNIVVDNDRLTCYAQCLVTVAFHYFGKLTACPILNTSSPSNFPTIALSVNSVQPSRMPFSYKPPPDDNDVNYFLLVASLFFVILDAAILSMLMLECSGLGQFV